MRITKDKLRKIIKEERAKILSEISLVESTPGVWVRGQPATGNLDLKLPSPNTLSIDKHNRQLRQIIRGSILEHTLNEMPVSKSQNYGSQDIDKRRPRLKRLAIDIDSIFEEYDVRADIQMFDSGYTGITIKFTHPKSGQPQN